MTIATAKMKVHALPRYSPEFVVAESHHQPAVTWDSPTLETFALLQKVMMEQKSRIDAYATTNYSWDYAKKFSNEYESIYSHLLHRPCVAHLSPPSRSYFKLWEIMTAIPGVFPVVSDKNEPLQTAHIAEGPGGFIESLLDWRYYKERETAVAASATTTPLTLHGMTLYSTNKTVPRWRISSHKIKRAQAKFHVHYGVDGTGNLFYEPNTKAFIESVGAHSCQFVSADGGFDIHKEYNHQEDASLYLLLCEAWTALRLQKAGGAFVLKAFDCFTQNTLALLYILWLHYDCVYLTKPLSSRPANSERFIVCTGFRGEIRPECAEAMSEATRTPNDADFLYHHTVFSAMPTAFFDSVLDYTFWHMSRQIFFIDKTLCLIQALQKTREPRAFLERIVQKQYEICRQWCQNHLIPYREWRSTNELDLPTPQANRKSSPTPNHHPSPLEYAQHSPEYAQHSPSEV